MLEISLAKRRRRISAESLCVLLVILATAVVRIRLLAVPLERDEGEYAYIAQQLLQGVPPYASAYSMKLPGVCAAYAVILALFGHTHVGIHLGLLLVNAATTVPVYVLGRRLFDAYAGVMAAVAFAILSLSRTVQGVFANAEHFVVLFAVAGTLILLKASDGKRALLFFLSGLLMGLAFLMKQHGIFFILFGGIHLVISAINDKPRNLRRSALRTMLFTLGAALPFALTCLLLAGAGVFERFWFWTFIYSRKYVSYLSLADGLGLLITQLGEIGATTFPIWLLAALPARLWWKAYPNRRFFMVLFGLCSGLAVCPGMHFRTHYFILALPAIALWTGAGASALHARLFHESSVSHRKIGAVVLPLLAVLPTGWTERDYLFLQTPNEVSTSIYWPNPFPESILIGRFVAENTVPGDCIAVLGSEPQICFYAKRRSATGFVYTYPLMERHDYALDMQREMIQEIERAQPKMLVRVNVTLSWMMREGSHLDILTWADRYCAAHYRSVGAVDIRREGSRLYWGDDVRSFRPTGKSFIIVFRRKESSS